MLGKFYKSICIRNCLTLRCDRTYGCKGVSRCISRKLGSSLTEIDLSVRPTRMSANNASEQDYDEKAEDAVGYEDIDEQYEGPEIQAATDKDNLLPEKEYFSAAIPFTNLHNSDSIFDDENYDEDEEPEKEPEVAIQNLENQTALSALSNSAYSS